MTFNSRTTWYGRWPHRADFFDLKRWLLDRGSLTTRLKCKGAFSVVVLTQRLNRPTRDEAAMLNLSPKHQVWVREVALKVDGVPLVFARSVLPIQPVGPLTRWFASLGNRSLGSMLFSHPGFSRGAIHCKVLDRRHALHRRASDALNLSDRTTLWARRSCFGFGSQSILVTEVFSPILGPLDSPHDSRIRCYDNATNEIHVQGDALI